VQRLRPSAQHVERSREGGIGGDFGPLLENSLRHDSDAACAAAVPVSGSTKTDLIRHGQALDPFRGTVHSRPSELELLDAGTAFADARDQLARTVTAPPPNQT